MPAQVQNIERDGVAKMVVYGIECSTQMGAVHSYRQMLDFAEHLHNESVAHHVTSLYCSPGKVKIKGTAELESDDDLKQIIDKACFSVGWKPVFGTCRGRATTFEVAAGG